MFVRALEVISQLLSTAETLHIPTCRPIPQKGTVTASCEWKNIAARARYDCHPAGQGQDAIHSSTGPLYLPICSKEYCVHVCVREKMYVYMCLRP